MVEVFVETFRETLLIASEVCSTILEFIALFVMMYHGVRGAISWWNDDREGAISLAEGIAMTLEFLLAAEVLHTVLANDVSDLIMLGSLVVMRAVMTLEIHLEMKHKRESLAKHEHGKKAVDVKEDK